MYPEGGVIVLEEGFQYPASQVTRQSPGRGFEGRKQFCTRLDVDPRRPVFTAPLSPTRRNMTGVTFHTGGMKTIVIRYLDFSPILGIRCFNFPYLYHLQPHRHCIIVEWYRVQKYIAFCGHVPRCKQKLRLRGVKKRPRPLESPSGAWKFSGVLWEPKRRFFTLRLCNFCLQVEYPHNICIILDICLRYRIDIYSF